MADGKFMMGRRSFVSGSIAATALAALAGCGKKSGSSDSKGGGAKTGGTLKYFISEPVCIDPYNCQESEGSAVEISLFDSLTAYDWKTHKIVPMACESYEVSDDGTQYTFHLVKGAKFHNGDPVDAKAWKRGWERVVSPKMAKPSQVSFHLSSVDGFKEFHEGKADELKGLTCPDDNTFVVKLSAPSFDFDYVTASNPLVPVPQAALDNPDDFLLAPIGNGPFQMDGKWESGQKIAVKRFDDYYGQAKPKIDGIIFSIQKDPKTAFREFEAGNIDFCPIPSGRIKELVDKYGQSVDGYTVTPDKQVITGAQMSIYYLILNLNDPLMKNPVLRRALSLGINRRNIVDTLFEGIRQPATSFIPPILDNDPFSAWKYCKYDKEAAKKLLEDNGLAGKEITISYNSGGGHEDIMSSIQQDLKDIGLNVKQDTLEWAAYLSKLQEGTFQIARLGWVADYPTLDNFLYPAFYSTAENNYEKYVNPEVDKALEQARTVKDTEERKAAYRKINAQIAEDCPVIPIMYYSHNQVGSSKIQSFFFSPQSKGDYVNLELKA